MTSADHTAEREEYRYRVEERLDILCGIANPTPDQLAIAESEADAWIKLWTEKHEPEMVDGAPM